MFKITFNKTSLVALGTIYLFIGFGIVVPLFVHAQSTAKSATTTTAVSQKEIDMQSAIRSVLAADPRAAALPPDQLNSMVQALSKSAEAKGLQPTDIHLPPSSNTMGATNGQSSISCDASTPSFICALTNAFGLDGSNTIPLWLGGTSVLLILLIGAMLEIHHLEHKKEQEVAEHTPNA